jgi:hypothetical protein
VRRTDLLWAKLDEEWRRVKLGVEGGGLCVENRKSFEEF